MGMRTGAGGSSVPVSIISESAVLDGQAGKQVGTPPSTLAVVLTQLLASPPLTTMAERTGSGVSDVVDSTCECKYLARICKTCSYLQDFGASVPKMQIAKLKQVKNRLNAPTA